MPSTLRVKPTYTHRPNFTLQDFALRPHRPEEQRYVPRAFTPASGSVSVLASVADFTFEYSVNEIPNKTPVLLGAGVSATFGKFTRKLLHLSLNYDSLDEIEGKIVLALKGLRRQKQEVPHDSIKRNYDLASEILEFLARVISKNLPNIKQQILNNTPE